MENKRRINIFEEGNEKNEMQRHLFIDQETREVHDFRVRNYMGLGLTS
jgi:hypothetical protein